MEPPKKPATPIDPFWQDEGFEFELTDLDAARRVLDDESISQFDVAGALSPTQWKRLRRPLVATDRALAGQAIDWLLTLPTQLRPQQLSSQFPRIANQLAEVWNEPEQCQAALDKLLNDSRKGRKGFPAGVHDELVALRDWTQVF